MGRASRTVQRPGVRIETIVDGAGVDGAGVDGAGVDGAGVDGAGPALVILPSYGRDGGEDYDEITARLVRAGWLVLRPQPRGVAGSAGPMAGLTLHDLADDVAAVIRALGGGSAVLLGHAFGNALSRMIASDHPGLVRGVILAASQASEVPPDIAGAPFIAGDLSRPEEERLAVLRRCFFAPGHDAAPWLKGWYPETLKMQREAAQAVPVSAYWNCGQAPMLEIFGAFDPFKPKAFWSELSGQFGSRIASVMIGDASHALFPEQPGKVAEAVVSWLAARRDEGERTMSRRVG